MEVKWVECKRRPEKGDFVGRKAVTIRGTSRLMSGIVNGITEGGFVHGTIRWPPGGYVFQFGDRVESFAATLSEGEPFNIVWNPRICRRLVKVVVE